MFNEISKSNFLVKTVLRKESGPSSHSDKAALHKNPQYLGCYYLAP